MSEGTCGPLQVCDLASEELLLLSTRYYRCYRYYLPWYEDNEGALCVGFTFTFSAEELIAVLLCRGHYAPYISPPITLLASILTRFGLMGIIRFLIPPIRCDHLNSESRGISFPLLRGESPEQHPVSSLHRSGVAAPGATTSGGVDDGWSTPEDAVTEAFNRLTRGGGGDDRDDHFSYRTLTSEFGSGSEANPALFAPRVVRPSADAAASRSRRQVAGVDGAGRKPPPRCSGGSREDVLGGNVDSRTIGDSHSGGDGPSRAGQWIDRGTTRRWFDNPSSYDDDDELFSKGVDANERESRSSNVAQEERPLLESSSGEAKTSTDRAWSKPDRSNAGASGLSGEAASSKAGGLRLAEADDFVLGGDVVEGYVSLAPELRRCVSGDGRGGGLLLSGPPDDSDDKEEGGLSMFREQMYEEGRHKGNLASR